MKKIKDDISVEIIQQLHSTLDISEVLQYFSLYLKDKLNFDSLRYSNELVNSFFSFGKECQNKINFNISIDNLNLGEVTITSRKKLSEAEVSVLEEQLCYLLQPLKNAITHFQVVHTALHDPLTNLLNRGSLDSTLERELKLSQRHQTPLSLMILDIDNFKQINDKYGHLAGDKVLVAVSNVILETIRETDIAFRIGGEEFLVLLSDTTPDGSHKLAERLRHQVENCHVSFESKLIQFTISLGVSSYNQSENKQSLISRADKAMYNAKNSGKNQVIISCEQ